MRAQPLGPQVARITQLLQRLSKLKPDAKVAPAGPAGPEASVDSLRAAFAEEVAVECPRNGHLLIRSIDKPFILPEADQAEAASWSI